MQYRMARVEEQVREALAVIIQSRMKDPRFPMIFSITGVKVTKDLSEARVYFSQLPDDEEAVDETLEILEHAKGFLRSELGRAVRLRITPDLVFFWDDTEKKAQRIEEILSGLEIPPAEEEGGEPGE